MNTELITILGIQLLVYVCALSTLNTLKPEWDRKGDAPSLNVPIACLITIIAGLVLNRCF